MINAEVFVELARKSEMILYETPNEFEVPRMGLRSMIGGKTQQERESRLNI